MITVVDPNNRMPVTGYKRTAHNLRMLVRENRRDTMYRIAVLCKELYDDREFRHVECQGNPSVAADLITREFLRDFNITCQNLLDLLARRPNPADWEARPLCELVDDVLREIEHEQRERRRVEREEAAKARQVLIIPQSECDTVSGSGSANGCATTAVLEREPAVVAVAPGRKSDKETLAVLRTLEALNDMLMSNRVDFTNARLAQKARMVHSRLARVFKIE